MIFSDEADVFFSEFQKVASRCLRETKFIKKLTRLETL